MYNSVVVRSLVRLWSFFSGYYEGSLVKKVADSIGGFLRYLFKGSVVKDIFTSGKSLIDHSFFYRIYSWIIDVANRILKNINLTIKKWETGSMFFRIIRGINKGFKRTIVENNFRNLLLNSIILKFIIDLFSADEAGDQWW